MVVLPSGLAAEIVDECEHHDEVEQAVLDYTQRERVSPKSFYPFNEETERIYREWKSRH